MNVILKKQRVIDSYAALIENGQGGGQKFFDAVQIYLKNANLPNVSFEIVQVATRILARGRDYILVTHKTLREFQMYISAQDFGNYLNVTWALTLEPGVLARQLSKMTTGSGHGLTFAKLDLFTQQELDAYTTVVHRAVTDTVESIYKSLNQDFTKVNTRSRSGLAAW
jgi:hypothetical protein